MHEESQGRPFTEYVVTGAPESWELALEDVRTLDPDVRLEAVLAPGVLVVRSRLAADRLAHGLRSRGAFVRHFFPVLRVVPGLHGEEATGRLAAAALGIAPDHLSGAASFSVQTRVLADGGPGNFAVNEAVSDALRAAGYELDVRRPDQVVSIVVTGTVAYLGISPTAQNLSDWAGGMRRFAREAGRISRAEFKLLEAMEVFRVVPPEAGWALDLGAAPGGWTRVLRSRGLRVVAVDPARLDGRLAEDRGVRHVRSTAETYLAKRGKEDPAAFDWIVNDMRVDAAVSARLMVEATPLLKPGGIGMMTVKLKAKRQRQQVRAALGVLSGAYRVDGARKLFHNRSEVTVCVRRPD